MKNAMNGLPSLFLLGILIGLSGPIRAEEPPPGVVQILERGRIAAIFDPKFVTAEEAEIAEDAWVLGVVIDDQARAYSLNLLNRHEVVNDQIGEKSFAAVW